MMIIERIKELYDGEIELREPNTSVDLKVPEELRSILAEADGILETMTVPKTGEKITVGWILYSYEEMMKETAFFRDEYGIRGTVFADDGAGNPYYILYGKVFQFNPIDNESEPVANSLEEFFTAEE